MTNQLDLSRNDSASRYEGRLDDAVVAFADYQHASELVVLPHTVTEPEFQGRGFAGQVVKFALDDIRAQGRKVLPTCPFVRDYITAHPDYRDLLPA